MLSNLRNWFGRRRALRELQHLDELAAAVLTLSNQSPMNRAKVALEVDDQPEALRCWREARERFPEMTLKSHDSLTILLGLKRYDEAEALMVEGRKRFPRDPYYVEGFAELAARRNDFAEAVNRWQAVRKKFPTRSHGYISGGGSLIRAGRLGEAETLLEKAVALFPGEIGGHIERARCAEASKNWEQAVQRWQLITEKFAHPMGVSGTAKALMELGRLGEASTLLTLARQRYPINEEIVTLWAHLAGPLGDTNEEIRRWRFVLERFPLMRSGYTEGARRLNALGEIGDADSAFRSAIDRFPQEAWPRIEYAACAHDRQDWQEATTRWDAVRAAWPDRPDGYQRGAAALDALSRHEEATRLREEWSRRSK